jgi:hypothetical protein
MRWRNFYLPMRRRSNLRARRLLFTLAVVSFTLGFAGCGPLAGTVAQTTTNANVRIVHGSPDAGAVDVRLNTTTGEAIASTIKYGSVGAYAAIPSGSYSIVILPAGGSTAKLTCATVSLAGGTNYTIVVGGTVAKGVGTSAGLQCELFGEPTFSTPSGDYTLSIHHASPAAAAIGDSTVSFGTFTPGSTAYNLPSGTASYAGSIASGLVSGSYYTYVASGVTTAPGVGFWIGAQTAIAPSSVLSTILPTAGQTGASGANGTTDTGDLLPFNSLANFSLYLVDGANGATSELIGAFD